MKMRKMRISNKKQRDMKKKDSVIIVSGGMDSIRNEPQP